MNKELLFTVTSSDCDWEYIKGSGKGGQAVNKTNNAVRCKHRNSGAVGYSHDTRSQDQNKKIAFRRMFESKEFQSWHKLECMRRLGQLKEIEEKVDREMKNIKIEKFVNNKWEIWNGS